MLIMRYNDFYIVQATKKLLNLQIIRKDKGNTPIFLRCEQASR